MKDDQIASRGSSAASNSSASSNPSATSAPSATSTPRKTTNQMKYIDRLLQGAPVEWRPLGEVGEFSRGSGLQKKDFTTEGVGCIHYGQIYTHYGTFAFETKTFVSEEFAQKARKAQCGDLVIATTSENDEDLCKAVAWLGKDEVVVSSDACFYTHKMAPKYVSYFFQSTHFQKQKRAFITGTKVRRVNAKDLAKIEIPIPPVAVQEEVVRILDKFTALEAELEVALSTELDCRRRQYRYYRDALLSFDLSPSDGLCHSPLFSAPFAVEWRSLGEVGEICMCKRILKEQTSESGEIPFYKIGTFGGVANSYISRELFTEYRSKYRYPNVGDILISASGTIGRTVVFDGTDAYFQDSNIVWIDNDERLVTNRFLYYYYQVIQWSVAKGGTIQRLYNDAIKKAQIPVPPLAVQERIVEILDKFDTLVNSISEGLPCEIELRRKQYEYYRDALLSF